MAGRVLPDVRGRMLNLTGIVFLCLCLFIFDLPRLFANPWLDSALYEQFFLITPVLIAPFFLLNAEKADGLNSDINFFHGLIFSLLLILIALVTLWSLQYAPVAYPVALFRAALLLTLIILLISAVWLLAGAGQSLQQLWSPHLPGSSSSFEQWLATLSQPGSTKTMTPEQFLESGLQQLKQIPWITGVGWTSNYGHGALGDEDRYKASIIAQSLEVVVFARHPIQGSYYAHIKLLVQLLEHFHQARRREEDFAQQAHLQAIHETGAKLTHDIKNLLQSLYAITSAIQTSQPAHFGETQRLLQGQLPHLSQRLKRTLDKLQQPSQSVYSTTPVRVWWDNLCARYRKRDIEFTMRIMWNANIPEELFDNVVENLMENALNKRNRESELEIRVTLETTENQVSLTVCDNGSSVSPEIEKQLLNQPVPSRDGFGIGLYQAAKQTIHTGYRLHITHNQTGQVCFELASV